MIFPRARHELRSLLGQHPALFLPLIRLKPGKSFLAVRPDTRLVIEGYPRSGNTFAAAAFELAQPGPVAVARHLHVPAQVIWAARREIPVLILVRDPRDAVVSWVIRHPEISLELGLRAYERFHRRIVPYADRFVVARFEQVVSDFGAVIRRVNRRFGTEFVPFVHDERSVEECFRLIETMDRRDTGAGAVTETTVGRPSAKRESIKTVRRRELEDSAGLRPALERSSAIYERFVALADDAAPVEVG